MPFHGRKKELHLLGTRLEAARSGVSGAVAVIGEAGIGKSRLLSELRSRAHGFQVLHTRGHDSESDLAFAALTDLLRPVVDRIAELPPLQRAALGGALAFEPASAGDRFRTSAAFFGLLGVLSENGPVLVVVDDAQSLDAASREALLFAARRLDAEGILIAFAGRAAEPFAAYAEISPMVLTGLDEPSATAMVNEHAGVAVAPSVAQQLQQATAGNPLALAELARSLTRHQLLGFFPLPSPLPTPRQLDAQLLARVRALPTTTQRALLALAVADGVDEPALQRVLRLLDLTAEAFLPAEAAAVVRFEEGHPVFAHPLLAAAVVHHAAPDDLRRMHQRFAEDANDLSRERRALHLARSSIGRDDKIAAVLTAAAADARNRSAYASAGQTLALAANFAVDRDERVRALLGAATDLQIAGRLDQAADLCAQAERAADDVVVRARVRRRWAAVEMFRSGPRANATMLRTDIHQLASRDRPLAVAMLADAATSLMMSGDTGEAIVVARQAVELSGEPHSDDTQLAEVVDAVARLLTNDPSGAPSLTRKIPFLANVSDPERLGTIVVLGALPLIWIDEHRAASALLEPMRAMARAVAPSFLPLVLPAIAQIDVLNGRLASALAAVTEAISLAQTFEVDSALSFGLSTLCGVEALLGRADGHAHAAEAMSVIDAVGNDSLRPFVRRSLGLLALGQGDHDDAAQTLMMLAADVASLRLGDPGVVPWKPDAIEALTLAGRRDEAITLLSSLDREVEATGRLSGRAGAARGRGIVCDDDGFATHFDEALAIYTALGYRIESARTHLCYGRRLRETNRYSDAQHQLRAALAIFEAAGAEPWIHRVRDELRQSGNPVLEPLPTTLAALTSKELQIALAVAKGLTNREVAATHFLSTRTVDTHLTRVYRKLGVRSRTELAVLLARHASQ
ncbi:MAG: AAA family ATPase [Acidimicrobiia bacterium]